MAQKSNILWYSILATLALSMGAVYYYFKDYFEPKAAQVLQWDSACDLRVDSCVLQLPHGGSVNFEITPKNIPLLEPIGLEVTVTGEQAEAVEVDFSGVSMNMGFNRTKLKAIDNGKFIGNITLPVCVRNRMEWEAAVMLEINADIIVAPFRFETVKAN